MQKCSRFYIEETPPTLFGRMGQTKTREENASFAWHGGLISSHLHMSSHLHFGTRSGLGITQQKFNKHTNHIYLICANLGGCLGSQTTTKHHVVHQRRYVH